MAPVPRIPWDPSEFHLTRHDRQPRPTLSERFPRRPYYRFYYAAVAVCLSVSLRAAELLRHASV
jgi:hypothetical protein